MPTPAEPVRFVPSRRSFLKTTSAAALGTMALSTLAAPKVHASGDDVLRVALIGCGGRGTGAAKDALMADTQTILVAMGDVFPEQVQSSLANLKKDPKIAERIDVPPEKQFVGFDAFQKAIDAEVDVVLLCTPPHFRPAHIAAAVKAGKHIFAEKPCAVDAPGVRSVLASCAEAKQKNLAVMSGLCWRYDTGVTELMDRVHGGDIGEVLALQCNYLTGQLWVRPRQPNWSDMEWQMRNWLYFTWLSGDHNNEQHIHSLDKMAWVMKDQYPVSCYGVGGRSQRIEAEYGNVYDHHAVVYEYANGVRLHAYCRQMNGCFGDVSDYVVGSKGKADVLRFNIEGEKEWRHRGSRGSMYVNEHKALFSSIRRGEFVNNGDYMAKSSLMAIMGRMATYTGQKITWEMAMNSKEDLSPAKYEWGPIAAPAVAIPGRTQFV